MLLLGLEVITPSAARAAEPVEEWERAGQAAGFLAATVRDHSMGAFDRALARSGYPPVSRFLPGGGFGAVAVLLRWRIVGSVYAQRADRPNAAPSGIGILDARVEAGYDVLRWESLSGYVLGGVGLARVAVDPRAIGASLQEGNAIADTAVFALHGGLEDLVPLGRVGATERLVLTLAVEYAYARQLGGASWSTGTDDHSIAGPSIDTSGATVSLRIGVGVIGDSP